jgi:hypothetical protein
MFDLHSLNINGPEEPYQTDDGSKASNTSNASISQQSKTQMSEAIGAADSNVKTEENNVPTKTKKTLWLKK